MADDCPITDCTCFRRTGEQGPPAGMHLPEMRCLLLHDFCEHCVFSWNFNRIPCCYRPRCGESGRRTELPPENLLNVNVTTASAAAIPHIKQGTLFGQTCDLFSAGNASRECQGQLRIDSIIIGSISRCMNSRLEPDADMNISSNMEGAPCLLHRAAAADLFHLPLSHNQARSTHNFNVRMSGVEKLTYSSRNSLQKVYVRWSKMIRTED